MKNVKAMWRQICELVFVLALAAVFIVMKWWIPLIIEGCVVLVIIVFLSNLMVTLVLKRKTPILTGTEGTENLKDTVRDAVVWLESGELWEQTSEDGLLLKGRFLKKEGSHTYALCCHGYRNDRLQDISNQARKFYEWGHNVFAGHARGHGRSEGRYIGMACRERRDIAGWIRRIVEMDPEARIFLYGVSMGGATVMTTSGEDLPDNVRCAIEDCGYSSIWNEFSYKIGDEYGLPVFPILNISQMFSRMRYGFGFREYSALDQLKKTKLPFLFIHGDRDTFVSYDMLRPVYEACASEHKKMVTIEGARHAEAYQVDPERYWQEVSEWLAKYL